ncbi:MAG: adenosine kinase [SAR86 cluster bacterium]|nr:adenosine kinase [SAR86 cluster bacterium]
MNKIYGFGNALIDIEINIDEKDLKDINIKKGGMKHISKEELDNFLKQYSSRIKSRMPGGSIANSLYAANQNGSSIHFSCSIGDDDYGDYFINSFNNNKKIITYQRSKISTGICLIFITEDGQRTMASNLGANLELGPEVLNTDQLKTSDYLLFDNFSLSSSDGLKTVIAALRENNKAKICFGISDESLVIENIEYLKWLSQNKVDLVYGNTNEVSKLKKELPNFKSNILETNGEQGASYNDTAVPAPRIEIVNSNGAGDALIGTFLALKDQYKAPKALSIAVGYASRVCKVNGPRLQ